MLTSKQKKWNREYSKKNRKKINEYQRKWRKKAFKDPIYKAKRYKYEREWAKKHPEFIKRKIEYNKKYRVEHKKEILKKAKQYHILIRKKLLKILGGKCIKCNFSDWRALQVDHIDGGGHREKILRRKGRSIYYEIIRESIKNNKGKYQLLCANCNWIKKYENEENGNKYILGV